MRILTTSLAMKLPGSHRLGSVLRHEHGQTMAEYGVVISVITLVTVGIFAALAAGVIGSIARAAGLLS